MRTVGKWILYTSLFVLTAFVTLVVLGFGSLFVTYFYWVLIPSEVAYPVMFLGSFGIYIVVLLISLRKRWGALVAASLGGALVPAFFLVGAWLLPDPPRSPTRQAANQREPSLSPSGKYVLCVPIERSKTDKGPYGFGMPYWHVTISDPNGNIIYRDPNESFHGIHNVYWVWDEEDRVWLFNSDDGGVYLYESVDGVWRKIHWTKRRPGPIDRVISPPKSLYPSYWTDGPPVDHIAEPPPKPPGMN